MLISSPFKIHAYVLPTKTILYLLYAIKITNNDCCCCLFSRFVFCFCVERVTYVQLSADKCKSLLIQAICSILMKCKDDKYRIVILPDEDIVPSVATATTAETTTATTIADQPTASEESAADSSHLAESSANVCKNI